MQRLLLIATTLLVTTLGCTTPTPAPHEGSESSSRSLSSRLIGGTPDTGDPAVVVFTTTGSEGGECTAEFISTTVLLTAAHCVLTESGKPLPAGTGFRIYQGHDMSKASAADWITIDPSNVHPHPSFKGTAHDIAVLVLSKPVAVTPLAFTTQALSSLDVAGKSVRLIGYGANVAVASAAGDDGFGVKRQLTTTVASVEPNFVLVGKAGQTACSGDSGGPALLSINGVETIIGLDSYSDASVDCSEGEFYQRLDVEAAFIAQFMKPGGSNDDPQPRGSGGSSGGGGEPAEPGGNDAPKNETTPTKTIGTPDPGGCSIGRASRRGSDVTPVFVVVAFGLLALARRRRD